MVGFSGVKGWSSRTAIAEGAKFVSGSPGEDCSPPGLPLYDPLTATTSGVRSALLKRSSGNRNAPVMLNSPWGHSLQFRELRSTNWIYYCYCILGHYDRACQPCLDYQ